RVVTGASLTVSSRAKRGICSSGSTAHPFHRGSIMHKFLLAFLLPATALAQQRVDRAEHHEFAIENFRTESGTVLPKAVVVYGTYGHLNPARDNVVLLPSHYMANHHGYEWLIGPGRALDTARLYLVATELFGNGHSSSPSNTPEPFHGPRFPVT